MTSTPSDLTKLSACELRELYRRKAVSPVEVTKAVYDCIDRENPSVNAFCVLDPDSALEAAIASEQRWAKGEPCGWVDGVPTTIKDVVLTKNWPTLRGSLAVNPEQPWMDDAPCTARLREQGAVLLGKTTTPEFGWKGVTDSPRTGITRNPWDTRKTPGGSSGGAAAAAALGMGALHIGTDGGGSIRIPAGFTGVFGHKPSFGRVPAWPSSPFGTVAHVGPMARTVQDAALMLNVLTMPDKRDWYALPQRPYNFLGGINQGVHGLRIALSPRLGYTDVDPEVEQAVRAAAAVFEQLGATVEEADPGFDAPDECFRRHWFTGAAKLLATFAAEELEKIEPGLRAVAEMGAAYSGLDYLEAVAEREQLATTMQAFHDRYDLLLTPALPIPAFDAGQETPEPGPVSRWTSWTPFTFPFNLTQQPACSAPCGFTKAGLPIGLQIVGAKYADALVLRAARAYETACPFKMPEKANIQH